MSERQKTITTVLFWCAFGVFLGVSIPHIAWIVRQYMPQDAGWLANDFYWLLALAYAVAIDGIMAWLTHAQSSHQGGDWKSAAFTWAFIVALVAMSWYLNWLYNALHDPSKTFTDVWNFVLMDKLWAIPQMTVANFTPVLLGALPVFTIAYVGVLNNVQHMRAQAEKSLAELQQEADEKEERAQLMQRIKDAEKSKKQGADQTIAQAFGLVKKVKTEAQGVIGERKEKKDPQALMLAKVVDFYRATPHLLMEEQHAESSELIIKDMLKLRKVEQARAWRIQAAEVLRQEQVKVEETPALPAPQNHVEVEPETEDLTPDMLNGTMPNKLQLALDFLRSNPSGTDEELAEILELNRPASARFWRLKAMMNLEDEQNNSSSQESEIDHPEMEVQENIASSEQGTQTVEEVVAERDVIEAAIESESSSIDGRDTDPELEAIDDENFQKEEAVDVQKTSIVHTSTMRFTRRKPLTVLEVAEVLGCSERHVRNLRSDGKLLPDEADKKNLITAGSVKAYLENRTRKTKVS